MVNACQLESDGTGPIGTLLSVEKTADDEVATTHRALSPPAVVSDARLFEFKISMSIEIAEKPVVEVQNCIQFCPYVVAPHVFEARQKSLVLGVPTPQYDIISAELHSVAATIVGAHVAASEIPTLIPLPVGKRSVLKSHDAKRVVCAYVLAAIKNKSVRKKDAGACEGRILVNRRRLIMIIVSSAKETVKTITVSL